MASLDTIFQRSMARATPSVFGSVLTALMDRLTSTMADIPTKTESTLQALSLLLDLQIPSKRFDVCFATNETLTSTRSLRLGQSLQAVFKQSSRLAAPCLGCRSQD